jgi:hypothetical protein
VRRRRVIIVLVACVLVGIGAVAIWPGEREPEYNGKKLSEWLNRYEESRLRQDKQNQRVAADAIQHIGTNALPCLVKWIQYGRPAWKDRIAGLVLKTRSKMLARWYMNAERLRFEAIRGFEVLGPEAAAAVPQLAKIVNSSRGGFSQRWALDALSHIGKDAFPTLLAALENPETDFIAADCICQMAKHGVDISPAIPTFLLMDRQTDELVKRLEQPNARTLHPGYYYVLSTLLFENRPFLIPALTKCLHHPNNDVRIEAAKALGRLGQDARPAAPALREALDVRVIAVQEAALSALEKIAPEVLPNGVKDF